MTYSADRESIMMRAVAGQIIRHQTPAPYPGPPRCPNVLKALLPVAVETGHPTRQALRLL
jgi:hypothetical protein